MKKSSFGLCDASTGTLGRGPRVLAVNDDYQFQVEKKGYPTSRIYWAIQYWQQGRRKIFEVLKKGIRVPTKLKITS